MTALAGIKKLQDNYNKPTPDKWRKIGDLILVGATSLSVIVGGSPLPDKVITWVVFGLNILGLAGKLLSGFFTSDSTPVPPVQTPDQPDLPE